MHSDINIIENDYDAYIDKVIYAKGRLWTIFSVTLEGVFCVVGIRPTPIKENKPKIKGEWNTRFFKFQEIEGKILEDREVQEHLQKMRRIERRPLNKTRACDFLSELLGCSRSSIVKYLDETPDAMKDYKFVLKYGLITYELTKEGRMFVLKHDMHGMRLTAYFDMFTFEPIVSYNISALKDRN
ncbi:hypothetical protein [Virgibacillus salexigens]|uniref:hypothetical protein n=1 Tax=Virgibacillus massiliensis TaxID=1462526 RepID=UPI00136EFFC3|nr:hypothetical protein [Virgibacillus massiliensis]MYL43994.1 hypothetical protein [Virgibacillus massiliensis]